MTEQQASTARRRELGAELRRLRERQGFNGLDMATRLQWTQTMLSRVETGKRVVTPMEVLKYTTVCGLDSAAQQELLNLAVEPDDYRIKPHDGIPDELQTLIFHESTATAIDIFEPIYIPGLTQTEDYIRALFEATGLLAPADVDDRVDIRLGRRSVLTRVNPAQCAFYVHEHALRMMIGSPRVMHEQMLHLLFTGSRPQCSIRVVPASAGPHGMAAGTFHIFSYPEGAPVVYVQHETTSEFLESRKDLRSYQAVLNRVARVALTDAQSREFIAWMASEYEQQGAAQDDDPAGLAEEQLQRR
jgi:transcriptional regulator with XRE-family HTH domain